MPKQQIVTSNLLTLANQHRTPQLMGLPADLLKQTHLFANLMPDTPEALEVWTEGEGVATSEGHQARPRDIRCPATRVRNGAWGENLSHVLDFGPQASMTVSLGSKLARMEVFAVELLVRPSDVRTAKQRLVEGQSTPFSVSLARQGNGFRVVASAYLHHRPRDANKAEWVGVTASKNILPNRWSTVAVVFTGDDLILIVNGRVSARRVLRNAKLGRLNQRKQQLWFGTWVDGKRNRFRGQLGGARVWDTLPSKFVERVVAAEDAGVGAIESRHADWGGDKGTLGKARSPERKLGEGRWRSYAKGAIYWHPDHGAHPVFGKLWTMYNHARVRARAGFPITDPIKRGSKWAMHCERGAVYASSTKAGAVWGPLYARYLTLTSVLGLPVGMPFGSNAEPERRCKFEKGMMYYSSATGAFEVHGTVLARYKSLGADTGMLGLPTSDELPVHDGNRIIGRVSRFQNGSIFWSGKTGAFEVHGKILERYEQLGGPRSELGFPVTNERVSPSNDHHRYSMFERGMIVWDGTTAHVVPKLVLHVDNIKQFGAIDDGAGDSGGEFYTRLTVKVDGKTVVDRKRFPRKDEGNGHVRIGHTVEFPVRLGTKVYFKVDVWDWDAASGDDYHGRIEKTLTVHDLWATATGLAGARTDNLTTIVRDNTPDFDRIRCHYTVSTPSVPVNQFNFRRQGWWHFANKKTPTLSKAQYVETFRDVDFWDGTFEAVLNAFDALYYEYAFKEAASGGNCFGFSTEGMEAYKGQSPYSTPLSKWNWDQTRHKINIKQAYQYGAETIHWAVKNLGNLNMINPRKVFDHVEREIQTNGVCIVSIMNLDNGTGHAVLAYRTQRGGPNNRYGCIFVADPNEPWPQDNSAHPTYVEVFNNNTFKAATIKTRNNPNGFQSGTTNFANLVELPNTLMFHVPYRVVCVKPRTPFWEVLGVLFLLLGFLMLLAGDAEAEQVTVNGKKLFRKRGSVRKVTTNQIPGLAMIPGLDANRPQLMFASENRLGGAMRVDLVGRRRGSFGFNAGLGKAGLGVKAPISAGARDSILVDAMGTPFPVASFETSQSSKIAQVDYGVVVDPTGRPARHFKVPLQQAKGDQARVAVEGRGGGLLLSPAGPRRAVDVEVSVQRDGALRKGIVRGIPATTGAEAIRIRPQDIDNPLGNFSVERLSSIGGGVLERRIIKGKAR